MSGNSSGAMTKAQRRAAAQEKAKELREAQQRRERRNRFILLGGVGAVLIAVAVLVAFIFSEGSRSPLDRLEAGETPANVSEDGGIRFDSQLVAGEVGSDAPELSVYLDFACRFCLDFEVMHGQDIADLVAADEMTVAYYPVAFLGSGDPSSWSVRAAQATAVVTDGAPEHAEEFLRGLFELYEANGLNSNPSDAEIAMVAADLGVPQEVVDRIGEGSFQSWVGAATQSARNEGDVTGTPAIFFEGEQVFTGPDGDGRNWSQEGSIAALVRGEDGASEGSVDDDAADEAEND